MATVTGPVGGFTSAASPETEPAPAPSNLPAAMRRFCGGAFLFGGLGMRAVGLPWLSFWPEMTFSFTVVLVAVLITSHAAIATTTAANAPRRCQRQWGLRRASRARRKYTIANQTTARISALM